MLLVVLLGIGWAWLQLRLPPPPDWRALHDDALAAQKCEQAYVVAAVASAAHVPGGFDFWLETYGNPLVAGEGPPCGPSWEAMFGAPDAPADQVAEALEYMREEASNPPPPRPDLTVSRLGTAWAAFNGFWVEPGYDEGPADYRPDFMGLSLVDRVRAAWAVALCDPVRGSTRPNWRAVEAWTAPHLDEEQAGDAPVDRPWQRVAEKCARAVVSLVEAVGIDASGGEGRAVDSLLHYAREVPHGDYLYVARPLVHGEWPWFVDTQDEAVLADHYADLFYTFGVSLSKAHGPSLVLYARKTLDGTEPRYLPERRWDFAALDTPLTDDQYAYGMLLVAVEQGEAVDAERDAVGARLSEAEQAAARDWAYRYFGEPLEDGERAYEGADEPDV